MIVTRGLGRGEQRGALVAIGLGRRVVVPVIPPLIPPGLEGGSGGRFRPNPWWRKEQEKPVLVVIRGRVEIIEAPAELLVFGKVRELFRPPAPLILPVTRTVFPPLSVPVVRPLSPIRGRVLVFSSYSTISISGKLSTEERDAALLMAFL